MKWFFLTLLACQLFLFPSASASTVEMGEVFLRLNSETSGNNDDHLFDDVLTITSKFLNDYFRAYYQIDTTYFKSVTLRLRPFNIQTEPDNTRTAQLEFAGILSFSVQPVPTTNMINKLIENAFTGRNLGKFLEVLMRSHNNFLENIQNIEVVVGDNVVTHELDLGEDSAEDKGPFLTGWMAILVYGVAIAAGILLAIAMVAVCRCFCCKKSARKAEHRLLDSFDDADEDNPKNKKKNKKQKKLSKKARKGQKEKLHNSMFSDRPPSPDKSEYSYNHNDISMLSTDTGAMSLMSKASLGLTNYNQATETSFSTDTGRKNRRRSGASIPYGQDVSLLDDIQLNVLGQIEEDNESMYSVSSRSSSKGSKKAKNPDDSDLEIRKPKKTRPQSKLRQPTPSVFGVKNRGYSGVATDEYLIKSLTDSTTSPTSSGSGDFGADVIDDLNDLSFQIKAKRGTRLQI